MPDRIADDPPELLTITEAADALRTPRPPAVLAARGSAHPVGVCVSGDVLRAEEADGRTEGR